MKARVVGRAGTTHHKASRRRAVVDTSFRHGRPPADNTADHAIFANNSCYTLFAKSVLETDHVAADFEVGGHFTRCFFDLRWLGTQQHPIKRGGVFLKPGSCLPGDAAKRGLTLGAEAVQINRIANTLISGESRHIVALVDEAGC